MKHNDTGYFNLDEDIPNKDSTDFCYYSKRKKMAANIYLFEAC